jgi:FkbM family methyltransferase
MNLLTNDSGISRSLILFGRREEDKKYILKEILHSNMKIFDIGANIGYYTIFFVKNSSHTKILAIEPSAENLNLCKNNIRLNNINTKNIKFKCAGVSDKNSKKKFLISSQSNLHTFNSEGSAKRFLTGEFRNIATHTVYYLSKKFFIPDLIRMDVEGHECEIISGMLKHIEDGYFKPHICFEPHITSYSRNNKFSITLKKLFNLGYYTNLLSSNAQSGTDRIYNLTKIEPFKTLKSDGVKRSIFKNVKNKETIKILTKLGGARTVLLSPKK